MIHFTKLCKPVYWERVSEFQSITETVSMLSMNLFATCLLSIVPEHSDS